MVEIPTLPDSLDNAAKNLTDKPTAAIGQTVSELWQLVLGGRVSLAAEKQRLRYAQDLEKYRQALETKVLDIPEDKQVEPSIQIAAQALEDSQYCIGSEELREMFANLIARSMHSDYSEKIHPSFSKIAQQLSPLDAQMLTLFYKCRSYGGIAIADYIQKRDDPTKYTKLKENVPAVMPPNCTVDDACRAIISLQRLGLVTIPSGVHFAKSERYDCFKNTQLYDDLVLQAKSFGYTLDIKNGIAKLTVLGDDFVSVCLD